MTPSTSSPDEDGFWCGRSRTIYEAREVSDPANEDRELYAPKERGSRREDSLGSPMWRRFWRATGKSRTPL